MTFPRCVLLLFSLVLACTAIATAQAQKDEPKQLILSKTEALTTTDPFDIRPTSSHRKIYEHKMLANQPYVVTIASPGFSGDLRIENATGQPMATATLGPRDAYALFTPK